MVKSQGLSTRQVCNDISLRAIAVRRWLAQSEAEQLGQSGIAKSVTAEQPRARQLDSENRRLRGDVELLKINVSLPFPRTQMSHTFIRGLNKKATSVSRACRVLAISRSRYSSAAKSALVAPKVCAASVNLKAVSSVSNRAYGSRRLCKAFQLNGIEIGRYRVRTLTRAYHLRWVWRLKFVHNTDSKHTMPIISNVLDRKFARAPPNQVWVTPRDN